MYLTKLYQNTKMAVIFKHHRTGKFCWIFGWTLPELFWLKLIFKSQYAFSKNKCTSLVTYLKLHTVSRSNSVINCFCAVVDMCGKSKHRTCVCLRSFNPLDAILLLDVHVLVSRHYFLLSSALAGPEHSLNAPMPDWLWMPRIAYSGRSRQPVENTTGTLLKTVIHSCITTVSVITDRITVSFFHSVVKLWIRNILVWRLLYKFLYLCTS